ncbi:F0F1 ATP synthase subunit gamma [Dysgonomonas sp. 216]|uniref:F0F1 ATP synthase subunit gamma n=1 Tax=Dysgonomonas sp. 216 TaxID=2302934 RepID=UPI0013D27B1C|nr:F0F1 ATP synthase subunit gamma [Dysgonomonas sp. 216]NDW19381.1 F0F1 ATP synthase subunit gamma [Dysgonomonas sp. 216]
MASLREVKDRISSVNSTRKITSAMKMIASSKLHKAQAAITNFLPYSQKLDSILLNLLSSDLGYDSPFSQKREVTKVAIVSFSSNSSLCGAFNANVIKETSLTYDKLVTEFGAGNVLLYPIGKKIADAAQKNKWNTDDGDYQEMLNVPAYQPISDLAKSLINKFIIGDFDRIILIYHHFKSTSSQVIENKTYLPFDISVVQQEAEGHSKGLQFDYIYEPSHDEILTSLIPKVLASRLFAALLDSVASEHAARTIAMQTATDNANDLIQELTIQYNKTRQYAITNELLDIIGGASALE